MKYNIKQLFIFGFLVTLGVSQTGCGRFSGHGPASLGTSPAFSSGANATDTANGINSTAPSSPSNSSASAPPAGTQSITPPPPSPYPTFGLDVSGPAVLALNERLAELGYLPVSINGGHKPDITLANLTDPPQVSFSWNSLNVPPTLAAQWSPDTYTAMTRAAVIAVEHQNGLDIDGITGEMVWKAILGPNAARNQTPYTYVFVTKNPAPEMLNIWRGGKWIYHSVANTGVSGAPSTDGTFAVFKRYRSQTMRGKNPNGKKYIDKGVPYVNYYDGSEAIHGFARATYGSPQSVGCVELPIDHAKKVWSLIDYGTLVTVEGHYVAPGKTPSPPGNSTNNTTSAGSTTNSVYGG